MEPKERRIVSKEIGQPVVNLSTDKIKQTQNIGQHSQETVGAGPCAVKRAG